MKLADKVAIVTGATQGIGLACAERLVREGARVMLVDIKPDGEHIALQLAESARFFAADVSQKADVDAMIAATLQAFGRIDILVNNAAVFVLNGIDASVEEWREILDVNVMGPAL
jgi:glucose 1-dehydrogenase